MIEEQIALEKQMTQDSIDSYLREFNKQKQGGNLGNTKVSTTLLNRILEIYVQSIEHYLEEYSLGKAVKSTISATTLKLLPTEVVAYIAAKVLLNKTGSVSTVQSVFKAVGQALEDEFKLRQYREENKDYYQTIISDLNNRGARGDRKRDVLTHVFSKKLDFFIDSWSQTAKYQVGMVLTELFMESTGLIEYHVVYRKGKTIKYVGATTELLKWIEETNAKLGLLQPFYLPMICQPKEWTGLFEGGYISPYLKRNKLIKNNDKEYLTKIKTASMPQVYSAINHLQNTKWQINRDVLKVIEQLWEEGREIAGLPEREDIPLIPFPYPDRGKASQESWTEKEMENIKKWKRETYEIHKKNIKSRSIRILTAQIIKIAQQFQKYDTIWYPYQMDFRGRLYPIPVLLQPQGSDLAKGLLRFGEGKPVNEEKREGEEYSSVDWLKIHGANVWGYDKENYRKRIEWVQENRDAIQSYAKNPMENRGWTKADKPIQFLAWCLEYNKYLDNPDDFLSYIPIQLDGTCNGLQHYSALLRDEISGGAVNLTNHEKPSDIYGIVAERLKKKLEELKRGDGENERRLADKWLELGLNRKLTKRPVMVLPYGGTRLSCREYITEYLNDNYSSNYLWQLFGIGDSPTDCVFKVSTWLSKYLWESITETLQSAIVGMDYLRKIARIVNHQKQPIEWLTPVGLLIREAYNSSKKKRIQTELFGSMVRTDVRLPIADTIDSQKQVNGICPNFIHSLDAACLMLYLNKCKDEGINSFMTVHDCYGTHAADTERSARLLREAFVEIYKTPVLENFTDDVLQVLGEEKEKIEIPLIPERGELEIEDVLKSDYFFN